MAKIVSNEGNELTLQMTVKLTGSLMDMEKTILDGCNEMGGLATAEALQKFDTDGSPIKLGEVKMTVRDKTNKTYQTPYGGVLIQRNVNLQRVEKSICPLENNAQIIRGATPKFAQQISHKYANMNAPAVCQDLKENHHRKIPHSYLQDVSDGLAVLHKQKKRFGTILRQH